MLENSHPHTDKPLILWPKTQFVSSSKHLKSKQKPHQMSLHLPLNFVRKIVKNENTMDQFTHVSSVRSLSHVRLFAIHGLQHARPPCSSPTPRVYSNSCPLSQWYHPTISSSDVPFSSHLQSFIRIRVFSNESALHIRWPKYWSFSFNISPSSPLGCTGWISLQSKGLSRVFSNTTVQKHQFFDAQLSL